MALQIAREKRAAARAAREEEEGGEGSQAPEGAWAAGPDEADLQDVPDDEAEGDDDEDDDGPMPAKKRSANEADREAEAWMRANKQQRT